MGRHYLTVLLPITERKHLYPQHLSGDSWASSQASFSRPRMIPYRDLNPGSLTPSNAIILSTFRPLASKPWPTIITCRSLLTVRPVFWRRRPYLSCGLPPLVDAPRNGGTLRYNPGRGPTIRQPCTWERCQTGEVVRPTHQSAQHPGSVNHPETYHQHFTRTLSSHGSLSTPTKTST